MRAAWVRRSTPRICSAWRMRWSTVWGEMWSSAAISLDERCWSTSRRQSSWPGLRRATREAIGSSFAGPSCSSAASGKRAVSLKAKLPPRDIAALPEQRVRRRHYVISRHLASFLGDILPLKGSMLIHGWDALAPDELARVVALRQISDLLRTGAQRVGAIEPATRKESLRPHVLPP